MNKKIMLVDDDEIYQFIFEQTVKDASISADVISCKTATEGLEYLKAAIKENQPENIPDLIFLDINMPIMNGWDFLEEFRKLQLGEEKRVAFAMLSSSVFESDKEKASHYSEVIDFIVKPLTTNILIDINRRLYN